MLSGGLIDSATPQGSGRFTFEGLKAGKYVVSVRADGFIPIEEPVEIPSGYIHNTVNLIIRLTPKPETVKKPPGEKTVVVQSLAVPKEAQNEIIMAEKAAKAGDLGKAIQHAGKALEFYPEYFKAHNNLAVYYFQSGNKQASVDHLKKALSLNPDAAGANANLGRVYLELKRPTDAIPYLKRASELDQTSSDVQYHLARAYILSFQFPEATKPLRLALKLEPPVEHARFLLAHVLYEQRDVAEAIRELELYLKTKPENQRELERRLGEWRSELSSPGR
jgi:tetratricopeptide (TPR) repeat protein